MFRRENRVAVVIGLKAAFLLALACVVVGCSRSRESASSGFNPSPESIIGKWRGLPRDFAEGPAQTAEGQQTIERMEKRGTILDWEFKPDHTLVGASATRRMAGRWKLLSVEGRSVSLEVPLSVPAGVQTHPDLPSVIWKCVFESEDRFIVRFSSSRGQAGGEEMVFARIR